MTTVREVCDYLKSIAPLNIAEDWDNVGLLLGDNELEINGAMTCLTLTTDVAAEAVQRGAGLVVTHHPVLFKPVKKITTENAEGRILLTLLRHGIAVYSPHTAWDNAADGINQQLAEILQLRDIAPLRPRATADHVKVVTFVPEPQLEKVRQALWDAGAGTIGDYDHCSFNLRGTGTFFGSESTNPAVGRAGQLEFVDEIRLEVVCTSKKLEPALAALRAAHPYEEPAVDIFSVKGMPDGTGAGRFGTLAQPLPLAELNRIVSQRLRQSIVQFTGDPSQTIRRLGIACGAAAEFLKDAHRAGCQALLTGEARFHACLEANDLGLGMILPGHYATERFSMEVLAQRLTSRFPNLVVTASQNERDPVQST
jgi:dinuclear metal center YbgI/SA1388 family protein